MWDPADEGIKKLQKHECRAVPVLLILRMKIGT